MACEWVCTEFIGGNYMGKFITFGEIMLRLAPVGFERFLQAKEFGAVYGGGEANVAVSLANYGKETYFVTKLPKHEVSQAAVNELRKYGVDTNTIVRGGERVGIYYCEKGASQRPSNLKHTVEGDFNLVSIEEVAMLKNGDAS